MMGGQTFEEAFPALFAAAYRVAVRVLDDRMEAEDVAAEATARALDRWRRVSQMTSSTGWVIRVASNLATDVLRRRPRVELAPAEPPSVVEDPDTRLDVRQMLAVLPRRQRDVVALRFLVDMSEEEIAEVLGISAGSVKQHTSRALHRLRRHSTQGAGSHALPKLAG